MDDELVALLARLVAIPSLNPYRAETDDPRCGEAALAEFVAGFLRDAGLAVELAEVMPGRPNVVASLDGPLGGAPLLFVAHLDTVPVEGMTIDPFAGEVRDGLLYGRGACDTKGSMAAMLAALRRVAEAKANRHPLMFVATVDEESGFNGIRAFLAEKGTGVFSAKHPAGRCGKRLPSPFRMAFVGEPTGLALIIAHRGVARYGITTHGKSAHSAIPGEGVNAIYRMAPIVTELEALAAELQARPPHPLVGPPSLSVGTIRGGHSVNTVPDRCAIEVDRRLVPGETPDVAEAAIRAIAERGGATVEPIFCAGAFEMPRDSDVVRRAVAAAEAVIGQASIIGARYCTEAAELALAGIPAVVVGPGEGLKAHSADECIALDQLEAACQIYQHLMTRDA